MKSLYKSIGTALLSATLASGCALFQKPSLENTLRDAYGCIGTSKPVTGIRNKSLARTTSENRAREDRVKRIENKEWGCREESLDQRGVRVEYDPHNNIFIAYKPNK